LATPPAILLFVIENTKPAVCLKADSGFRG